MMGFLCGTVHPCLSVDTKHTDFRRSQPTPNLDRRESQRQRIVRRIGIQWCQPRRNRACPSAILRMVPPSKSSGHALPWKRSCSAGTTGGFGHLPPLLFKGGDRGVVARRAAARPGIPPPPTPSSEDEGAIGPYSSPIRSAAMKASCGIETFPYSRIRAFPFFCLSSSFFFREMSPP